MEEAVGWSSSLVLIVTIASQIHKQWRDRTSKGVSRWLFVGQILASLGFTVYSALVHNTVFVVTNTVLLASAVVGLGVTIRQQAREKPGLGLPSAAPSGR